MQNLAFKTISLKMIMMYDQNSFTFNASNNNKTNIISFTNFL